MMNKGPWGGRGAKFLKPGGVVGWSLEPGHIARSRKMTIQPTTPPDFRNSAPLPPHRPLFIIRSYPIT